MTPEQIEFFELLDKRFAEAVEKAAVQFNIPAKKEFIPIVARYYSDSEECPVEKRGKPYDYPCVRMKVDFDKRYSTNHFIKSQIGMPKTVVFDSTKPYEDEGETVYEDLMVDGEPPSYLNAHKVFKRGSVIRSMDIDMNTFMTTSNYKCGHPFIMSLFIEPSADEQHLAQDEEDLRELERTERMLRALKLRKEKGEQDEAPDRQKIGDLLNNLE
jgi:hypothetical protein